MGRIVLITGSTDGIGKQTALELAQRGYEVIIHGRDRGRAGKTVEEIAGRSEKGALGMVIADLASQRAVQQMSEELHERYEHLDVLINNAGVYQKKYELSEEGLELTFAVNHLSHFLLTGLLLDMLGKSSAARIVTVSSMIHAKQMDFDNLQGKRRFDGGSAYSLSKLCNVLFTYKLADILRDGGITANCLHPGVINTKLLRVNWGNMGAPVPEGARTSVHLASSPEVEGVTGKYFVNSRPVQSAAVSYQREVQDRLWEISERLLTDSTKLLY
jgi:NAD(P)-dependent dehydrogenase (short-subunit alcohol dehydrogenase family)